MHVRTNPHTHAYTHARTHTHTLSLRAVLIDTAKHFVVLRDHGLKLLVEFVAHLSLLCVCVTPRFSLSTESQ